MLTPDWNNEFEIMCDAIDYAMGAVMRNRLYGTFLIIIWQYVHPSSCGLSKWLEETACPKNDAITVVGFIQRKIFSRF